MKIITVTTMTTSTVAKARPTSKPLTTERTAATEAGRAGAGAGAAGLAAGAAGTARGAAGTATAAGAPGTGILMDGPLDGFGGRLMRTVCFFCAASAGLGGSAAGAGAGAGGTGAVGSDIEYY